MTDEERARSAIPSPGRPSRQGAIGRLRDWLEEGIRHPKTDISRLRRLTVAQVRLYRHVALETISGAYLLRAAALSFTTLLALVPVTVLLSSLCIAFAGVKPEKVEALVTDVMGSYFLAPLSEREQSAALKSAADQTAPRVSRQSAKQRVTPWAKGIAANIAGLAGRANLAKITVAGLISLIIMVVLVFNSIESGFNAIWHVRTRRRFWIKFVVLFAIILFLPLLITGYLYLSAWLAPIRANLRELGLGRSGFERFALLLPTLAITWLAFFLAYSVIPSARVVWRNALWAALAAAILWEVAKHGFGSYVRYMTTYELLYGSLALIPIFMLWIFITWVIVLFGAGVTYTSQHLDLLENKRKRDKEGAAVSAHLALSLTLHVARCFEERLGPVTATEMAQKTGTSEDEIRSTLQPLVNAGLLSATTGAEVRYQPQRPLDTISLAEVLGAIRRNDTAAPMMPEHREIILELMGRSWRAEEHEITGMTLKEVTARLSPKSPTD